MYINKLDVANTRDMKFVNIFDGQIRVDSTTEYTHARELLEFKARRFNYSTDSQIFQPQELKFTFRPESIISDFSKLLFEDVELIFKFERIDKSIRYVVGKITSDLINPMYNMGWYTYTFTIKTLTHFFEIKNYEFGSLDDSSAYTYPYTYGQQGDINGFYHDLDMSISLARHKITNDGNLPAPFRLTFNWYANPPAFSIGGPPSLTYDAYIYDGVDRVESDVVTYSSFIWNLGIKIRTQSKTENIEQFRDFSKKTYLEIPQGTNYIYSSNIPIGALMEVYEQYYNLY